MGNNNNYGIVGDWHTSEDIKDVERKLGVGDRLEFNRGLYAHWGMYVGRFQGMRHAVVHFGMVEKGLEFSPKKISGRAYAASQKPEIRADTIGKILGGSGEVRINNSRDNEVEPLRPNDIIEKTKSNVRDKTPTAYNLYGNNCEHFVNRCRYGTPHSEQVRLKRLVRTAAGFIYHTFAPQDNKSQHPTR